MHIVGSLEQLGNWQSFDSDNCSLTWTQGHVWTSNIMAIRSHKSIFQYKYIIKDDNGNVTWENGYNRLVDLKKMSQSQRDENVIEIFDEWELMNVDFTIGHIPFPINENV